LRQIVLLRGINLGPSRRVPMADLRSRLSGAGYEDVRTYVQSGNIVLTSKLGPDKLAAKIRRLIAKNFELEIPVVTRTGAELAEVIRRNPLAEVAENPKRYQVSFLAKKLPTDEVKKLAGLATESERFEAVGRELYAWHPAGVARSKLWNRLASADLGVTATARNWTTVISLHEMVGQ
jgi:uncharacterized protein (DUF1697 family)